MNLDNSKVTTMSQNCNIHKNFLTILLKKLATKHFHNRQQVVADKLALLWPSFGTRDKGRGEVVDSLSSIFLASYSLDAYWKRKWQLPGLFRTNKAQKVWGLCPYTASLMVLKNFSRSTASKPSQEVGFPFDWDLEDSANEMWYRQSQPVFSFPPLLPLLPFLSSHMWWNHINGFPVFQETFI